MGQSWVRHARSRLFVPESAGGGGGFDPADYGADYSWWAGRLESFTNGQNVTTWMDRGSGTLTVSAGAGQEPTFHTAADPVSPNGQSFLRWASGDRLLNLTTGITGPWTTAIVFRPTSIPVTNAPVVGGDLFGSSLTLQTTSGGRYSIRYGTSNVIANTLIHPITPLGWQVFLIGFTNNASARNTYAFKSGLSIAPSPNNFVTGYPGFGTTINVTAGTFQLGGNTYVGEIAEAVVWRSEITNANKILIGKALADLYGVTY